MRRVPLRLLSVVIWAGAAAVVAIGPTVARADPPQQQGWWTAANPGGSPANPATAQADVPPDGLLVQAGPVNPTSPCGCTAYAGLVYELTDGVTASDLTLKVAPNSATTPVATLELCTLVNPTLNAEQGGPLGDAPAYDCKDHATASLGSGDSSFTFHVGSLVSDGILAVAVLPGDSTSRVVLSKPDSSALATTASTSVAGTTFTGSSNAGTSTANGGGSTSSGGGGSTLGGPPPPSPPSQPAVGGTGAGQTPVVAPSPSSSAPALAASPVASASTAGNGSTPVAAVILVAGLAVGAALWALAGRGRPDGVAET